MTAKSENLSDATVLIIEDNLNNFVLMARLLAYLGIQRCEWKVLEFAESLERVDLILMDIFLPDADGYQSLAAVRSSPRFKDVPIVAVTADASLENMLRAKEAGFNGFIGKPLAPDRFPEQIRRIFQGEEVWERM